MARIRTLVVGVAKAYAAQGEALVGLEAEVVAG
jgi:glycyl-tRNA synthetase alpha chain